jgi:hypothetical protein
LTLSSTARELAKVPEFDRVEVVQAIAGNV